MDTPAGVQIFVMKVASLGFLRFFQHDGYSKNTWQMFAGFWWAFFYALKHQHEAQPALSSAYLQHPLSSLVYQGIEAAKVSIRANFSACCEVRSCVMDRDEAPSETLQSSFIPRGTDSPREAELAGKGSRQRLLLQPYVI